MKPFKTVLEESISEFIIQKSRFITYLIPIRNEEEGSAQLDRIRKLHWDATHHVPAWVLSNGTQKFSDDGEPGGTAGLPVLESLKHGDMQNCMLVVVRYFGGVKLGTGGLVRAYGQAARDAIAKAERYEIKEFNHVRVVMEYTQLGRIQAYLSQSGEIGIETVYMDNVELTFFTDLELSEKICEDLTDLTHGSADITVIGTELLAVNGSVFVRYDEEETL